MKFKIVVFLTVLMILLGGCATKQVRTQKAPRAPKSALVLACESYSDPHDKEICFKAQSIELAHKASDAKHAALKSEPLSMREARKEEVRLEKRANRKVQSEREAYARAAISGCESGESRVWIDPVISRRTLGFVNAKYTVINQNSVMIDEIRDDATGRIVVRNLCKGERLTITKVFPVWADGNQVPVSFTAIGMISGKIAIAHSPQTTLTIYQAQYQPTQVVLWDIRLQVTQ